MFKKFILTIIVFASVATASTAFAQDNKNTAKRFIARQLCDEVPKMMDVIKGYKEDLLFLGKGTSFEAQSGKGFTGGMVFFTNQETGTWSMLQLYGDGIACLVMNGRDFAPYGGPKLSDQK